MELWLILPDIHDKHPERLSRKIYHPAVQCAEKVIQAYQPVGIMYLGDATDMESLCYFDRDKRILMEGRRYNKDIESLKHMLDRHEKIAPKSKRIYLMGNHEDRVRQYVEYHSEAEGQMDFISDVGLVERGYEVIPYTDKNNFKKLGKASFMHGYDTSATHSAKMARTYQNSVFYGHVHDIQSTSAVNPQNDKEPRITASIGCLCDLNPRWMKNLPNKWLHGFGMFWLKSSGDFQMDVKVIVKGKTIINGKEF